MSTYTPNGYASMHESISHLLMDNGAAVTKPSVDAIIKFISERDELIVAQLTRNIHALKSDMHRDTNTQTDTKETAKE